MECLSCSHDCNLFGCKTIEHTYLQTTKVTNILRRFRKSLGDIMTTHFLLTKRINNELEIEIIYLEKLGLKTGYIFHILLNVHVFVYLHHVETFQKL